ncbi:wall-associated receptor kinase-like 1 [Corylus avellana]|uniref:wall-associated receptor kinase-like 1 n=1 Tax=Corylus avellana TaxID=13451 RepID=UPI00286B54A4|nr:wall-associated receptor kinase-like 1 [Corylus avellana]
MVFQIILLLCSIDAIIFVQAADLASHSSSCQRSCGNVSDIPFPFGIGAAGCFVDEWFEIVCNYNDSLASHKPVLKKLDLEVLNISLSGGTVHLNHPTFAMCDDDTFKNDSWSKLNTELATSPFIFSQSENIFIAIGCDIIASIVYVYGPNTTDNGSFSSGSFLQCGCISICNLTSGVVNASSRCNGIDCCQATIPSYLDTLNISMRPVNSKFYSRTNGCNSAFLIEKKWFQEGGSFNISSIMSHVPVVLGWRIPDVSFYLLPISDINASASTAYNNTFPSYICSNITQYEYTVSLRDNWNLTYTCSCKNGFEGNPYLLDGCQDINECERSNPCSLYNSAGSVQYYCENTHGSHRCRTGPTKSNGKAATIGICSSVGSMVLLIGGWWSYKVVKKRRRIKQKNKFFKRNGGLLLQQQLSSHEANVENTKLFNSKDLEKATDRFNVNRILGQGGQGTVYKGMLADGRIVAVKKSKVIDEGKLGEFINEVVILSQINHRNVVKLIGCCLETEVPLLVYEYIPNGTLFQYVNGQIEEFPLTWDMRLRIATEVAEALFYLHSLASSPIYHRDIKSTNILLDEKYRAKVADFGTSRSITVDQTHLTTLVHGTFGYLDPEYLQSSQFTEKSDVYSFGVVLAELLTGEKAISSTRTQESKSLATYFIQSVEGNNLFDVLDSRVLKEGKKEEIIAVANLAKRCLNLNGKKRPTMKEVTKELEAVQTLQKAPNLQQNYEELEYVRAEMYEPWDAAPSSTMSTSSVDAQPLLPSQSV